MGVSGATPMLADTGTRPKSMEKAYGANLVD